MIITNITIVKFILPCYGLYCFGFGLSIASDRSQCIILAILQRDRKIGIGRTIFGQRDLLLIIRICLRDYTNGDGKT